jgi:hypothetical protein
MLKYPLRRSMVTKCETYQEAKFIGGSNRDYANIRFKTDVTQEGVKTVFVVFLRGGLS